jgi:hypothetical protein
LTALDDDEDREGLPTFSECVVGYRSWRADGDGQLWPLRGHRRPWQPGINTARCECGSSDRLHFEWSVIDGRRVLEPAPLHDAPAERCTCGLYSLRVPQPAWSRLGPFSHGDHVGGAVASWGRIQVHGVGVRAEHACVLALAVPDDADHAAVERIQRAAARYGVQVVALGDLRAAACEHGRPLPAALHAAAAQSQSPSAGEPEPERTVRWAPAPNATEDEVDQTSASERQRRPRPRHIFLTIIALLVALIILLIAIDHRTTPCHLQIINASGTGGTIERCVSTTTPGQ